MINLLPTELQDSIKYGRHNRVLLHWLVAILIVIASIGLMTIFGQMYINKNAQSLARVARVTQDRISAQNLQSTQKDIQALSNNFTTVVQLLNRQLLFSKLFVKIGSIVPQGAILSGITLATGNTALDLNVMALDREAATQAFVNISDGENGLFEKADLISINCIQPGSNDKQEVSKYPCNAAIKVIIKTDSSFYFLNTITGGNKP